MAVSERLMEAIDELYVAFEQYERPPFFLGCACCWGDGSYADPKIEVESPGGDRPLRSLSAEEIRLVADQVPQLGGDTNVYRHYLPRVLEVAVTEGFDWPDFEPIMHHLCFDHRPKSIPRTSWAEAEQAALRFFFDELWAELLTEGLEELSVDDLISGLIIGNVDVAPLLERWVSFVDPMSGQQLLWYLEHNSEFLSGQLRNAFLSRPAETWVETNVRRMVRWLNSHELKSQVRRALANPISDDEAEALSECLDLLPGTDQFGPSALEQAIYSGDQRSLSALLSTGADANAVDEVTGTLLWQIAFDEHEDDIAKLFIKAGANVNAVDKAERTLLNRLVESRAEAEDIHRALELGADPMGGSNNSWTPLHHAASSGNFEVSRFLFDAGANPLSNRSNRTPLQLAIANGHAKVAALLIR